MNPAQALDFLARICDERILDLRKNGFTTTAEILVANTSEAAKVLSKVLQPPVAADAPPKE